MDYTYIPGLVWVGGEIDAGKFDELGGGEVEEALVEVGQGGHRGRVLHLETLNHLVVYNGTHIHSHIEFM